MIHDVERVATLLEDLEPSDWARGLVLSILLEGGVDAVRVHPVALDELCGALVSAGRAVLGLVAAE